MFPDLEFNIRREADQNPRFSRFLDQGREHRFSNRLGWVNYLKAPITRLQRYSLLLATFQNLSSGSDGGGANYTLAQLTTLISDIRRAIFACDSAYTEAWKKVERRELRFQFVNEEQAEQAEQVLPDGTELQYQVEMSLRESRFRDMIDVTVLVLKKPSPDIIVLRPISPSTAIRRAKYEMITHVGVSNPFLMLQS